MIKKKLVVLTGAGMSAESGIPTFRGADGLWEGHRIEDVATPEAWQRNRALVLEFYNQRRKNVMEAKPNEGHLGLTRMENDFDVKIITQNVDDLHERAGSTGVLHLHGEIRKARSTKDPHLVSEVKGHLLNEGDFCALGSQLRPHIVWFGEEVPEMDNAIDLTRQADVFVVIGTGLQVYPAAGLTRFAPRDIPKFIIDPGDFPGNELSDFRHLRLGASEGVKQLETFLGKMRG